MRIAGQNFTPEVVGKIQVLINANPTCSRRKLPQQVCEWLDWHSPNGKLKEMGCRVALLKLHREGLLNLPAAGPAPPKRTQPQARKKAESRHVGTPVKCPLSKLGEIEIVVIKNSDTKASRQWNALMDRYHYLGSGPLCGAQLRYLIKSERAGDVGGFTFSATAWRLDARERWIGWDEVKATPVGGTRPQPMDWAEEEFGGAELGDQRCVKRLMTMARDLRQRG